MEGAMQEKCPQEWKDAFSEMISVARSMRHMPVDEAFADSYGYKIGEIGARSGLTLDESLHYGKRILLTVMSEHHA